MDRTTHASDAEAGWRLVQLARLAEDLEALGRRLGELLADFTPAELLASGTAELDSGRRAVMVNEVCAVRDAAEHIGWLGGDFAPHEQPVSVEVEAVAEAAREMLTEGSANVAMVQVAARLVLRAAGFPALATGIEIDPRATASWGDTTIADLLGSFRDGRESATAWVCASARISVNAAWASLDADELRRLTWALRYAPAR